MLKTFRASKSNFVVWAILIIIVIGFGGFGITATGSGGYSVAEVGDQEIAADEYARAVGQEVDALSRQLGRQLPMAEARQFGVDRMVLGRLVTDAALDDEAARREISTGDATVQEMVLATPAFRGVNGGFDREAYRFALERAGLTPDRFEAMLRREGTRELIAGAVQGATSMPETEATALLAHAGEERRFDWIELDPMLLATPTPPPTEDELAAFHEANIARYTRPETRRITYALLDPAALAATIEVPEADLRAAYDAAGDRFSTPERRSVERIGFGTTEDAAAALARITAGEITFDTLAATRGLTPAELDQGEVRRADLAPEAAAAVFDATGPGIVGPAATPLGPSLFRINAILAPTTVPFETARAEIAADRALAEARKQVVDAGRAVEDMIAGGARIEEIASGSEFEMGQIDLAADTTGGLADDPAFRAAAEAADVDAETDLVTLASDGLVTLRVDAIEPPAPIPLAGIRDRVAADWKAAEDARRLTEMAGGLKAELDGGLPIGDLATRLGRLVRSAGPVARTAPVQGAPAGLVDAVFATAAGSAAVVDAEGRVAVVEVAEVIPFDATDADGAALVQNVSGQLGAQAAEDVLALFTQALQAQSGVRIDQAQIDRVLAQFP
ncbi:peptidylprolyl isomerase [Amaricoccus sp.]|uniref:peptidylprolyl isomerase n=1 Tax=Amaricoccus sp. TaxID=1872485 RepID=UPI001B4DFBE2|nr:peptidylprolyl isomerase [Amaricoccus sp.]MBP7240799.1 peptidylprolyl isomerase [Amaricoccus sp.]